MSTHGRYFIIRSRLNDLVMTLDGDMRRVLMRRHVKTWSSNQLWFEEHVTGTIRSKVNGYCLDVSGKMLQVLPYKSGSTDQDLLIHGQTVCLRRDPGRVLDIYKENKEEEAEICLYDKNGQKNQHWTFEYGPHQYLTISSMSTSEFLTAGGAKSGDCVLVRSAACGAEFTPENLWYEDKFGVLHSKLNDFALDSTKGSVSLKPYDASSLHQQYVINGNTVLNRHNHQLLLRLKTDSTIGNMVESGLAKNNENERWMVKAAG